MELKLIAKIDDALVYEVGEGKYITVFCGENGKKGKVQVNIPWTNPLGRFVFSVTKCSSDPMEDEAIKVIEENKAKIVERLSAIDEMYDKHPEKLEQVVEESNNWLDDLEEGKTVYLD